MNIGNQLKNFRILLDLTQEQFSAGVVTESFYSRVESNKNNISMKDLLAVLNYHHISLYDFFASVDVTNSKRKIMEAFLDRNIDKLKEYKNLASSTKYQLEFKLMFATLNYMTDQLSVGIKQEAKRQLLQIGKLTEDSLFNVNLLIPILDFQLLKPLMDYLLKVSEERKFDNFKVRLLYHVFLAFLWRCYQEKDVAEMKKVLQFLQDMSGTSMLFLERKLADCYRYLANEDYAQLRNTVKALKLCGYGRFVTNFYEISEVA